MWLVNHHAVPLIHVDGSCKPVNESGVTVVNRSFPTAREFISRHHMQNLFVNNLV